MRSVRTSDCHLPLRITSKMLAVLFICFAYLPAIYSTPEVAGLSSLSSAFFDQDDMYSHDFSVEQKTNSVQTYSSANQTPISTIEYWASIQRQWSLQSNCPCRCELDTLHRKVVFCDLNSTHVPSIPNDLDPNVQVKFKTCM
jgi:hypothetical protein